MTRRPLALEFTVLGFLRRKPLHGYQIHRQISGPEGIGLIWRLKQSQLYAILSRLEAEGLVTSTIQTQEARPPRRVYELSEDGRTIFLEWLNTPIQSGRQVRQEFLARLYFALKEGKGAALRLIKLQREVFQKNLSDFVSEPGKLETEAGFHTLVHLYRAKQLESVLDWLDLCAQKIQQTPEI